MANFFPKSNTYKLPDSLFNWLYRLHTLFSICRIGSFDHWMPKQMFSVTGSKLNTAAPVMLSYWL